MIKKSKKRSKNLTPEIIEQCLSILDGWQGVSLTWPLFIAEIELRTYLSYTRQALYKHERIAMAFDATKRRIKESPDTSSRSISRHQQTIEKLKNENSRLREENNYLLEEYCQLVHSTSSSFIFHGAKGLSPKSNESSGKKNTLKRVKFKTE